MFHMACKNGQFYIVKLIFWFGINFDTRYVNGMTHFGSKIGKNTCTVIIELI